jgi:hypothetical protein
LSPAEKSSPIYDVQYESEGSSKKINAFVINKGKIVYSPAKVVADEEGLLIMEQNMEYSE